MNKLLAKIAYKILMKKTQTNQLRKKRKTILTIYILFANNFHFIAVTRIQINICFLI